MYRHKYLKNASLGTEAGVIKFNETGTAVEIPEGGKAVLDLLHDVEEIPDPVTEVKATPEKPKEEAKTEKATVDKTNKKVEKAATTKTTKASTANKATTKKTVKK